MTFKFEQLTDLLLEDIFKLLHPEEAIELCFLSKDLFSIVSRVIRYNSTYSLYNQRGCSKYWSYQEKFIMENGELMKHINIKSENIEYLNYCSNIKSIHYLDRPDYNSEDDRDNSNSGAISYNDNIGSSNNDSNNTTDDIGNNGDDISDRNSKHNDNLKLNAKMPKLKKISIDTNKNGKPLNLFGEYLSQLEIFEYTGFIRSIETIIKHLNPDKLKLLTLDIKGILILDGLDIIKTEFNKLIALKLHVFGSISPLYDTNHIPEFNSNLELEIVNNMFRFSIDYFRDLRQLKSVKLVDYSTFNLNIVDNYCDCLKSFKSSNIIALGCFNPEKAITYDFLKLSTLKEVYFKYISKGLLSSISLLPNIQTIYFSNLHIYSGIFDYAAFSKDNFYKNGYDLIKCKFIKQIHIRDYYVTIEEFLYLISLFPNLEVVKGTNFLLEQIEVLDYKYIKFTPLLLIKSFDTYDKDAIDELLKYIPLLLWIKL
ncbi:hypothetical protein K502DRAFT_346252 [Neoconidiobolus thromboides FSU 785]|nr:hypothetical protein K502DRAFT_346252 [Neoconidiobolus thromboides FSU 785]